VRANWEIQCLGEIGDIFSGNSINAKTKEEKYLNVATGLNYIATKDIAYNTSINYDNGVKIPYDQTCNFRVAKKGSVLICSEGGSAGRKIGLLNQDVCFVNKLYAISTNEYVIPSYIFYYYQSIAFKLQFKERLTGLIGGVSKNKFKQIEIPIPPIEEQKEIVEILDQAFESIEKAKANIEKNIENAKELYQSKLNQMFIQFDESQGTKTIDDLCFISRGHNPPKSTFVNEPKDGYVRFWQIRDGSSNKYKTYVPISDKLHLVEKSDILMVAYRHIGRVFRGVEGAFNVALCKLSNKDKSILLDDYLFRIIPTNFIKGELLKRSERSLIPSMSVNHLKELKIPLPSIEKQKEIVETLDIIDNHAQSLLVSYGEELKNLEELKKSILQKAFSGELTNKNKAA
tara:strand:- start:266 stop:1468 length:1203 start_codon:yes stop_codon:yes gene_type:complete